MSLLEDNDFTKRNTIKINDKSYNLPSNSVNFAVALGVITHFIGDKIELSSQKSEQQNIGKFVSGVGAGIAGLGAAKGLLEIMQNSKDSWQDREKDRPQTNYEIN